MGSREGDTDVPMLKRNSSSQKLLQYVAAISGKDFG